MKRKSLFAATIALALVGSGVAYAQKPPLPQEDRAAVVDAHIAAHKAALKLTPDQEKNWPAYEAALRNLAKLRVERYQEQKSANPIALLRQRSEDLSTASVALKQLADAEEPLFSSLDDAQKRLFTTYGGKAR
jgi:hypothetical protein